MTEDEMLEIGITKEEYEKAFFILCNLGYLERKLDHYGEIGYRRTKKPFHKLELAHTPPRICQLATDIMAKVVPMIIEQNKKEFDDTLREMERDGLIESRQGDADIIISLTAKGRAWKPQCGYTL